MCLVCCEIDANRFVESLCSDGDEGKLARLQVLDCNLDADTEALSAANRRTYVSKPFEVDDVAGLSALIQEANGDDQVSRHLCGLLCVHTSCEIQY